MTEATFPKWRIYLYTLSFLEGAAVMSTELLGAKLLAPFFGTSMVVWASVLGVTLGGLMSGYFLGGHVSLRMGERREGLFWILLGAGSLIVSMPFLADHLMNLTLALPPVTGAPLALLGFLFPPLFAMGMVSPVIIHLLSVSHGRAGRHAGNVYAISTFGGILATFLFGFLLIPTWGINLSATVTGLALLACPLVSLLSRRSFKALILPAVALLSAGSEWFPGPSSGSIRERFRSEGILGEIRVTDRLMPNGHEYRILEVNRTMQTVTDLTSPDAYFWGYIRDILGLAEQLPEKGRALVLGSGAGLIPKHLSDMGFQTEAVDLDDRLFGLGASYFGLDTQQVRCTTDDARHAIRTRQDSFDLIVVDVFRGESAPDHVLTLEGLSECRDRLKGNGLLMINFYGYLDGGEGRVARSLARTLESAGFDIRYHPTSTDPDDGNLLFLAREQDGHFPWPEAYLEENGWQKPTSGRWETGDEVLLTDDRPREDLYARPAYRWRRLYMDAVRREVSPD